MIESQMFLIIVVIVTVLISITLHEAMHAFTSHWLGDDTAYLQGRVTLNPLKHIDPFLTIGMPVLLALAGAPILGAAKPVPFNPARLKYDEFGAALVALAGPLTNLVLAVIGSVFLRIFAGGADAVFIEIMYLFIVVNIGFFVFNMIPFPPLDGSRVLYALAPEPVQRVMGAIESYGLIGFVVFFFLLFNYIAPLLGTIIQSITSFLLAGVV
jgi:Zn-dependent protease